MIYKILPLKVSEVVKATNATLLFGDENQTFDEISTDSRTIGDNTLFVSIKGEKFDADVFLGDVSKKGAKGYLTSGDVIDKSFSFAIKVENSTIALGKLASYYASKFNPKKVALTGSVGKTTTKELVASCLKKKFNTCMTKGNFNNNIGVAYTLFTLEKDSEALVLEMGMNNFGEIDYLSSLCVPDVAIITNIGTSHIEFLGSQEGILKAKSEIFNHMSSDKSAVLNGDDKYLLSLKDKLNLKNIKYVGINNKDADYVAYDIETSEEGTKFKCMGKTYKINLAGVHNVYNALVAICVGEMLGMCYEEIKEGLNSYVQNGIRQNIESVNGYKVFSDCYNASTQSDICAIDVLNTIKSDRKVAILGDIGELGQKAKELHQEVGSYVEKSKTDVLITVGEMSKHMADMVKSKKVYSFDSVDDLLKDIDTIILKGDAILIKASRFMKFERISDYLRGVK